MNEIDTMIELKHKAYSLFAIGMDYTDVLKAMKTVKAEKGLEIADVALIGVTGSAEYRHSKGIPL